MKGGRKPEDDWPNDHRFPPSPTLMTCKRCGSGTLREVCPVCTKKNNVKCMYITKTRWKRFRDSRIFEDI